MKIGTNLSLLILLSGLLLIGSCKHEPPVLPAQQPLSDGATGNPSNGNGNGNGNGNNGNPSTCDPDTAYFQNDILPLFVSNCAMSSCHDALTHKEGIILDSYSNIMNTGRIRAFDPGHGKVMESITTNNSGDRMPPPPRPVLSSAQISLLNKWINQGAKNNLCNPGGACDTSSVTYAGTIVPMLQAKCNGCHNSSSAGGSINLTAYAGVQAVALNGRLYGSVNHAAGYSAMPKNMAKLADCEIAQIRIWIQSGALNN